jgi:L-Ala-D/L-Glu epimerase
MKIRRVRSFIEAVPLKRPYTIAYKRIDAVDLIYLELETDTGLFGLGSASPAMAVTGESFEACAAALEAEKLAFLIGEDPRCLGRLGRLLDDLFVGTPAARAAVDLALHDLAAKACGVPLVDLLGARQRQPLETSITLGIMGLEATLEAAGEYLALGFRCLKVKIGLEIAADEERLRRLRAFCGRDVRIRVDANLGYLPADAARLEGWIAEIDLELIEQPFGRDVDLRQVPANLRRWIAADESLHGPEDALALAAAPAASGIFNIKLMKCGGIGPAQKIATIAEAADPKIELMWGCMDESVISIAAALHVASACPTTRYLDLDGSFDLARDAAIGGFRLVDGRLHLLEAPGLGVVWR